MDKIRTHKDLKVYQLSFEAGMKVFELTKSFPKEELYSLTDQIRRSSRSVSGNTNCITKLPIGDFANYNGYADIQSKEQ